MKVKRKLLSVFLVISMLAGILPLTALPVYAANPPATDVSVYTTEGNQTLDSMYPYLVNGKKAKTGTLGSGGCTAYFDHTTGILTLQNHSGGSIVKGSLGGKKDLTVKLVGTNALTSALQNISGGDLIITAEDTATLSITNNTDTNGVITGISTDITGVNAGPGSITIRGKANISIYVENISTGVESGVRGIFAKQDISILDNASVNIECIGKGTGSYPVSGIQSTNKSVTFNTTGKVNIDCSDAQNKNPYAINNMLANILTSVDELTLKWTNGGRGYSLVDGGMSYDVTSFTRNIKEATPTQPGIEVFKKGTPLTLTIENGKNNFGKKEGQFTHGETVNVTANSITGLTFKKWVATAGIIGCATDSSTTLTMPDENVTLTAIYDVFAVQPKSAYVSATSRKVTFSLKATPTTYAPRLVTESGDYNDIVGETTFGHDGALNYSEVIRCIGIFDVPNGNYRIAAKFDDVWYYSDVFTVDYSTHSITVDGDAVETTDYTITGVSDFSSIPDGTNLTINAVNDINVDGENVVAGSSKTIVINSSYTITINKKVSNSAPTVVVGKETQTGNATPKASSGIPAAIAYEADMSGWFNDADGDALTYSVVSAREGTNDVSAHVSVAGKHITYTPAAAQAGKNVIIKIKANDGLADSTDNVTITVTVEEVPADAKIYKVTVAGDAAETTDYTISGATDLNAVPDGTNLTIYAVNNITVNGEIVTCGNSKNITINSAQTITINKKVGNSAPTVVAGKEAQTGNATPEANCGHPEAVMYEADMSGWFNDVDGDVLTYSVVSATEGTNDVSAHVSVAGKHITYIPAAAQAGKNVIIKIKANDGLADSTGDVTITVSVAAVPADTTYKVTIYGNAVITTDYTVSVADLNAVPHGTDLIIYAVNDITVSGEDVAAGGSKTIASIISPCGIEVKKKNNAPTVVAGKEAQTGNATPKANCGHPEAVRYEADMSGWFNDVDGDTLTYSVVSATEGANDVSAHVSVAGKHITYTPAAAQAGKDVIIVVKANDGLADSTGNVTITVSVAAVPADTTYVVTVNGDAVITTDYTVSVADLNAVPHGTNLTINAVNNIIVDGESVAAGGSKVITINSSQTITVNKVAIPKHTVTYDVDGGSLAAPTQDDVAEGATFAVASYAGTKAGFTFGGWNDGSSDYVAGAVYTMGTLNVTLTAVWNVASIAVTGVKLDSSTLTLTAGGSAGTLTATVLPMDAANKNITWASSDTSTATVSNGVVTPVAAGTATITVTTEDGGKTATCTVKVVPAKPTGLVAIKPTTAGGTDGMITGTSAIMEYANNVSFTGAVNCIGTKITNLSAGTYYVRVKATVAHDAGEAATVVVPAFVAIEEEDEDIYIPVTSPTIPANNGAVNIGYIESEGVVSLDLTDDKIEEIIKKSSKGNVDFNVSGIENATSVEIPKEAFAAFGKADMSVTVKLPDGSITLDKEAVDSVSEQAEGDSVNIELSVIEAKELNHLQEQSVKADDIVVDINISDGKGNLIKTFDGELTIQIPYKGTLPVTVWYLNNAGQLEKIEATYKEGIVTFKLNHLSVYVLGQDKDRTKDWDNPFTDVNEKDWYYDSVKFAHMNKLMYGVGYKQFDPHGSIPRGLLLTVLHRLEKTPEPKGYGAFKDVAANKYYSKAVNWAAENNIVTGYGDGNFGPNDLITREHLALILMNYAKYKGFDTSKKADLEIFADSKSISIWAKEAMAWVAAEDIYVGDQANLNPAGNATRCQVAAIFKRFIENVE